MKLLPFILLILASCSKSAIEPNNPESSQASKPTVISVEHYPVYAGSNMSIAFKVKLNIPNNDVAKVNLYRIPQGLRYYIKNPKSGSVIMYDHIIDTYPTYPSSTFYNITFEMTDGSKIIFDPFQVY